MWNGEDDVVVRTGQEPLGFAVQPAFALKPVALLTTAVATGVISQFLEVSFGAATHVDAHGQCAAITLCHGGSQHVARERLGTNQCI
jgi:hypothetical protein